MLKGLRTKKKKKQRNKDIHAFPSIRFINDHRSINETTIIKRIYIFLLLDSLIKYQTQHQRVYLIYHNIRKIQIQEAKKYQ